MPTGKRASMREGPLAALFRKTTEDTPEGKRKAKRPAEPEQVIEKPSGSVEITEIDGTITHGPARVVAVNLGPMEIQILGRTRM